MTSEQARHAAAVLRRVAPAETHEGRRACLDAAEVLDELANTPQAIFISCRTVSSSPSEIARIADDLIETVREQVKLPTGIPLSRMHAKDEDFIEPEDREEGDPKICPETGAPCDRGETCTGFYAGVGGCWLRHCRRASEPEGRNTGLHRDSMG